MFRFLCPAKWLMIAYKLWIVFASLKHLTSPAQQTAVERTSVWRHRITTASSVAWKNSASTWSSRWAWRNVSKPTIRSRWEEWEGFVTAAAVCIECMHDVSGYTWGRRWEYWPGLQFGVEHFGNWASAFVPEHPSSRNGRWCLPGRLVHFSVQSSC